MSKCLHYDIITISLQVPRECSTVQYSLHVPGECNRYNIQIILVPPRPEPGSSAACLHRVMSRQDE